MRGCTYTWRAHVCAPRRRSDAHARRVSVETRGHGRTRMNQCPDDEPVAAVRKQKHRGAEATLAVGSRRECSTSGTTFAPRIENMSGCTASNVIPRILLSIDRFRSSSLRDFCRISVRVSRRNVLCITYASRGRGSRRRTATRRRETSLRASALIAWSLAAVTRALSCMCLPSREAGRRSRVNLARNPGRQRSRRRSGML